MDERSESEATPTKNHTTVERKSERELVVTANRQRACAPRVRGVDQGRTIQEVVGTKSYGMTLLSCEMDVRVGGQYRLVFRHEELDDGVLRHVPRSDTALAPRLDQRGG